MRNRYYNFILENTNLYDFYRCYRKLDYYIYKALTNDVSSKCVILSDGSVTNTALADYDIFYLLENVPLNLLPYMSFEYYAKKYPRLWQLCASLYKSHSMKVNRVKKRVESILYDEDGSLRDCLWLALTFTDEVFLSTSQDTRRKYVRRFLKSQYPNFIANIDFGAKNGREHYHCIYGGSFVDVHAWKYGTIDIEHIHRTPEKIATYINKLSFHSVKDTSGFLIYSR